MNRSEIIENYSDIVVTKFSSKMWSTFLVLGIIVYLIIAILSLDILQIHKKWSPERASLFALDTYAHKDHVTMKWSEPDDIIISFEGSRWSQYVGPYQKSDGLPARYPEWTSIGSEGETKISFKNGGFANLYDDKVTIENWPDTQETLVFRLDAQGKPYVENADNLPKWIRVTENKIEVRPSLYERVQVYSKKVEVHRYNLGWNYFWFDFDSPLEPYGIWNAISLSFSGDRVDPNISNFSLLIQEFLNNDMWHHGQILWALLETIFMALLGTLLAALLGFPLAFFAAYNVTPFKFVRTILRRLFDTLRGIDFLIWSLIFLRAFGPGPFTGIFAIAITDTGTLGKLMSEAIENTEEKQQEGVESTGANKTLQHRFGIIPQILPIFISQTLYYLESNTRGAVIIGAMGAGGIGLQLLGAINTGTSWENVMYMSLLILGVVIFMDTMSSKVRRALIGDETLGAELQLAKMAKK